MVMIKKPIKMMVRAEQIVKGNVINVTDDNIVGIRNTVGIKYDEYDYCIYDLIQEKYILLREENTKGVCIEIINVPFNNNKTLVNIVELKDLFKKYSKTKNIAEDLYSNETSPVFDQIEENFISKKNNPFLKEKRKKFLF